MTTEEGVVIRVAEQTAWIKTTRSSSCESCSARGSCNSLGGGKEMEVEAHNRVGAAVGDRVVIGFETASLMKASFLLYVFPILGLIVGAVGGQEWARANQWNESTVSVLTGFAALAIAFGIVRLVSRRLSTKQEYHAHLVRILRNPAPRKTTPVNTTAIADPQPRQIP